MGGDAVGHVVAEGVEIHGAFLQDLDIARLHLDLNAQFFPQALCVGRIFAADLHVGAVPVGLAHCLLVGQNIVRVAGEGIAGDEAVHVAHLVLGVVLVGVLDRQSAGHELMMQALQAALGIIRHGNSRAAVALAGAEGQHCAEGHHTGVDLVEGQPVFHLALIAGKDDLAVIHEEVDQLTGFPAVVLFHQSIG